MSETRQLFMKRSDLEGLPPAPALPEGYEVRTAGPADAEAIAAVMASAFGPEWNGAKVREELFDAPDVPETFVVTAGGVPVATASARFLPEQFPGSGYVHWVGGHADHRGKRLGYAVTLAVLHYFRAQGCHDAVLETDPPRLPAIRVYLSLGFRPVPVTPEHERIWPEILAALDATTPSTPLRSPS
jgi:mycothiol synthase